MVKSLLLGGEGAGRADEGEQSFSEIFVQRMSLRTSDRRHWCGNPFPPAFPWGKVARASPASARRMREKNIPQLRKPP